MKAALVEAFDRPPRHADVEPPTAQPGQELVEVRAAALSQLVRAQAAGRHYSSTGALPLVPGADGVGMLADGTRVYFAFPAPLGAMAERVTVNRALCTSCPDALDDVTAAALGNPSMSSWAALTRRACFVAGESVLVHGATGASGLLALQLARHLGARRVVATGRRAASERVLRERGADAFVLLDQPREALERALQRELADIDVVLDYLWGPTAEIILAAAAQHAPGEAARRVRYVNIGQMAGASITLPAATLRNSALELLGSGLGGLSQRDLVQATGEALHVAASAQLQIHTRAVPLSRVTEVWNQDLPERVVFLPGH